MWKYVVRRFLFLIPILLVVSFLVYWLMSYTGDPAYTVAGEYSTAEEVEARREAMGLNDPIVIRYFHYMEGVIHGDLGTGLYGDNVWDEFIVRLPYTVYLAVAAMFITVIMAIPLGIIAAVKQNTWTDAGLSTLAMAGISIPEFWLGLLLMLLFAVKLKWLPSSGAGDFKSIIMPAICAGVNNASLVTRMTRSSMVDQIRADYLRTARAKGVGERQVVLRHALKNSLIPIITIVGSQFSILMGGTVVVETVFAWPGVGNYLVTSIRSNDYTMVTGFVLLITVFVALVLLAVDILYAYADPRIKARYARS